MAPDAALRAPFPVGRRGWLLLAIAAGSVWAFLSLDVGWADLVPRAGGLDLAKRFFGAALAPDLSAATLAQTARAAWTTVLFAAAAMTLALGAGSLLGFLAATSLVPAWVYVPVRVVIAFMRSIHELMWAVLFNAALGLHPLAAVVAIAIPYAGTLAKVFSEMIDEAPRGAAVALRAAGATQIQVFSFGLLPAALPDMAAYAFYRFECALRSSAILGFFGYLTLGYYLEPAFNQGHYHQVWTYLYATFALVILVDLWSGRLRRTVMA